MTHSISETWQYPNFEIREYLPKRTRYCICIFTLNELHRLQRQLQKTSIIANKIDIIIADGGSTDHCTDEAQIQPYGVRTVLVKRGLGKLGAQMRMAFTYALMQGYEGIITADGNDKDDIVTGLPFFLEKLQEGYDHIQGSRFISGGAHQHTPLSRLLAVKLLHAPLLSLAARFKYTDTTNGFRGYSKKLLEDTTIAIFRNELSGYELHYYLAIEAPLHHYRCIEVPVSRSYPKNEKTPTKISPIVGNIKVLITLIKTCMGYYRPKQ